MKKRLSLTLIMLLMLTLMLSCSSAPDGGATTTSADEGITATEKKEDTTADADSSSEAETKDSELADTDNPWSSFDTAEETNIILYALGSKNPDFNTVISLANDRMKELINTTVEVEIIPLSDFSTKYPLLLAGGEDVDLIFCAPWLFFTEQADRGAYMPLSEEFLAEWMPETMKSQFPQSWEQAKYKGEILSVPRNESDYEQAYGVVVRKDIREKYDIPPIESMDDFETFLLTVAENEKGSGMFALNLQPSLPIDAILFTAPNNWFDTGFLHWDADTEGVLKAEDTFFTYERPEFLEYALRQARWAEAGVWPSNAITNTIHIADLFKEGTSAADLSQYKAANVNFVEMRKKGFEVEYYNILSETTNTRISPYYYDSIAITSFSKNPERAALALDVMKNDVIINNLLMGGIEGEHYLLEDGTHVPGPKSENYQWSSWAWALRSQTMPGTGGLEDSVKEIRELFEKKNLDPARFPIDGYTFDTSDIEAEYALLQSIISEYRYSFDLGVFGQDTEAKYNQFISELKAAGLDKVIDEARTQLADFIGE